MPSNSKTSLKTIVDFARRKGFVFPSSEIYGGFAATYDFGPLGILLKKNIEQIWRSWNVTTRTDMVEIEGAIFMHPKVWEASGHIGGFSDLLVEDTVTHKRYRADHLVEDAGIVWPVVEGKQPQVSKEKMQVLFATTNVGKIERMKKLTKNLNIELLTLQDIDYEINEPEEDGKDVLENSKIKAVYYWKELKIKIPVICEDQGTYFVNVEEQDNPYKDVKKPVIEKYGNSSPENQIKYYSDLAKKYGGVLHEVWEYGYTIFDGEHVYQTKAVADNVRIVEEPKYPYIQGFPFSAICQHKVENIWKYSTDMTEVEMEKYFESPIKEKLLGLIQEYSLKNLTKLELDLNDEILENVLSKSSREVDHVVCSTVFTNKKGALFVARRHAHSNQGAEKYEFVGGKIDKGETITECLKRELKEETNLDLVEVKKYLPIDKDFTINGKKYRVLYFYVTVSGDIKLNHEHLDYKFINSYDDLTNEENIEGEDRVKKVFELISKHEGWQTKPEGVVNESEEISLTLGIKPDKVDSFRENVRVLLYDPKTDKYAIQYVEKYREYNILGGGVEKDHSSIETANRELIEETGYTDFTIVSQLGGKINCFYEEDDKNYELVSTGFLAILNSDNNIGTNMENYEIEEGSKCVWKTKKEVQDIFNYQVKTYFSYSYHLEVLNRGLAYLESVDSQLQSANMNTSEPITNAGSFSAEEIDQSIEHYKLKSADGNTLSKAKKFNLLVQTHLGPVEDETSVAYLKGESCANIYLDWKAIQETTRRKLPFGIAQIGKAFRNEITVKQFMFRTREFEQMDVEFFVKPGTEDKFYADWKQNRWEFYTQALKFNQTNLQYRQHDKDELVFYAKEAWDIEYNFGEIGFKELEGIHNRTDYDTVQHSKFSGQDLTYFDAETNTRYNPYIVEMSAGFNRMYLAVMFEFYKEEIFITEKSEDETRIVFKLPYTLAPFKLAVLPLMKKDGLGEFAFELYSKLRKQGISADYDEAGSIGKRYRRQDENGTPWCLCIDYETIKAGELQNTVTLRHRDTMEQTRVAITELENFIKNF